MGLLDSMDLDNMDDTGMYVWAVILTCVGLLAALGIAVWWQKRKDAEKRRAAMASDELEPVQR